MTGEDTRSNKALPALRHLFGCYFHEDWLEDVSTSAEVFEGALAAPDGLWQRVIEKYIISESPARTQAASRELASVLHQATEQELDRMLHDEFGSSYTPGSGNVRSWLQAVQECLERALHNAA